MSQYDDLARRAKRLLDGVLVGGKTLLPVSTNPVPGEWSHVTKVDPELDKQLPLLYPLYLQHTDAVSVGGSSGVTGENTESTFELLSWASVPSFHEPSEARHVTDETRDQAEFLAIPEVLNGDATALVGTLGEGIAYLQDELVPEMVEDELSIPLPGALGDKVAEFATAWLLRRAVFEAYIIQNPESAAAERANVGPEDVLSPDAARNHALAADRHLGSEILYLEYSGTYGGEEATEVLAALSDDMSYARIWYGGGLASREHVEEILDAGATTAVVGDVFHDIAAEEADLCADAVETLDADASTETVREWVEEAVEVEEASAVSFLETIPSVADPPALATRYLTATVETYLALTSLLADSDGSLESDDDLVALVESAPENGLPAESALVDALASDRRAAATQYWASLLASVAGQPDLASLPARHLATSR